MTAFIVRGDRNALTFLRSLLRFAERGDLGGFLLRWDFSAKNSVASPIPGSVGVEVFLTSVPGLHPVR